MNSGESTVGLYHSGQKVFQIAPEEMPEDAPPEDASIDEVPIEHQGQLSQVQAVEANIQELETNEEATEEDENPFQNEEGN